MKTFSYFIVLIILTVVMSCSFSKKEVLLYVGTYSVEDSKGIYCYGFDPSDGTMTFKQVTVNKKNPSFLEINPKGTCLYAVSELRADKNTDSGSVTAYKIGKSGILTLINREATRGNHPCHVTVSPDGKTVVAANYTSGSLSIYDVRNDGGLKPVKQLLQHEGSGPDTVRQKGPHAHSSRFTKDGKLLLSADLGTDKMDLYELSDDGSNYVHAAQGSVRITPGSGPRHFDFSPDGLFIYLMNEMSSTVTVLKKGGGTYREVQTVSSLPKSYNGLKAGADIHIGSDGRFVYCSNRGHNSIAVFQRDKLTGMLTLIQNEPVQGDWPRNFAIAPDGRFLLVANQRSSNVTVFAIDHQTGGLTFIGRSTGIPSPVCLKFSTR
jgi:6-phosphogluconolactonase